MVAQRFPNLTVLDHPLIRHKLTLLRDRNTTTRDFRQLVSEISVLMTYEVTRDLPTEPVEIETPLERTIGNTGGRQEAHAGADPPRRARHGRRDHRADSLGARRARRPRTATTRRCSR